MWRLGHFHRTGWPAKETIDLKCVRRGLMFKVVCVIALALSLQFAPTAAHAQLSTTLSAVEVAATLQNTLGGTTVTLQNLGSLKGSSYHLENASSIKVPASVTGIPGQRTRFTLPDESRVILGRRYGYYVDRIVSNGFFVSAGAETFTFSLTFPSDRPALVGTCVRLRAPAMPCATLGEAALPAVEWRDARIDILLRPAVLDGNVTLDVQDVVIAGVFDFGKACAWPLLGARLCASLNKQSQRLRSRVASQVKTKLNSDEVREAVAAGVRQYLDSKLNEPLLRVRRISMQNSQLTIALGLGR